VGILRGRSEVEEGRGESRIKSPFSDLSLADISLNPFLIISFNKLLRHLSFIQSIYNSQFSLPLSSTMSFRTHTASPAGSQSPSTSSSSSVSPYIHTTSLDAMVSADDHDSSYSAHGTPNHSAASLPRALNAGKGGCWCVSCGLHDEMTLADVFVVLYRTCRVRRKVPTQNRYLMS